MTDGPVETPGEFAQFAEDSGLMAWLTDTDPGEQVAEEPQLPDTATTEQPRDDQGRFTKVDVAEETPDSEEVTAEADAPEVTEETADGSGDIVLEIDDDLQEVLQKYDGDVGKALKALSESQSMIGRQGNELGQLRSELMAMRQALEQGLQQPQQPQYIGPYVNNIDEDPKGLTMEALERGDGRTLEAALRAWGEYEPFEAATFLINLQQQAAAQPMPAQEFAPTAPTTPQGPSLEAAMSEVVSRHPDVEQYLPQVEQVAQEFPTLRDSMRSGGPAVQAQAFEELLKIAKARSSASATPEAVRRVVLKTQEEVRKEKADAAVVSAQHQSAATSRGNRLDQFYEAFGEAAERYEASDWITRSND